MKDINCDTQNSIEIEFMNQYRRKAYEKITVKGLCAETPIARTTFYSYYENIDEVKENVEDKLISGILELAETLSCGNLPDMDFSLFFDEIMKYIMKNWDRCYAFLIIQPNYRFMEKWKGAIKYHFKKRYPEKVQVPNYELVAEVIASAVLGAYVYWMKNSEKVDINRLNMITVTSLNAIKNIL